MDQTNYLSKLYSNRTLHLIPMIIPNESPIQEHDPSGALTFCEPLNYENILIDKTSADLLKGSEIDFVKERIGDSFKINNPQSKSSCGCGVSFSL